MWTISLNFKEMLRFEEIWRRLKLNPIYVYKKDIYSMLSKKFSVCQTINVVKERVHFL